MDSKDNLFIQGENRFFHNLPWSSLKDKLQQISVKNFHCDCCSKDRSCSCHSEKLKETDITKILDLMKKALEGDAGAKLSILKHKDLGAFLTESTFLRLLVLAMLCCNKVPTDGQGHFPSQGYKHLDLVYFYLHNSNRDPFSTICDYLCSGRTVPEHSPGEEEVLCFAPLVGICGPEQQRILLQAAVRVGRIFNCKFS